MPMTMLNAPGGQASRPQQLQPWPRLRRRRVLAGLAGGAAAALGVPLARAAGEVLRIGSTVDLSHTEKVIGLALRLGASAYLRAVNAAGGIHGSRLELVTQDDGFDPAAAKKNALALQADARVIGILHPEGTRQTVAVMEAVQDMAIVGPISGTMALRAKRTPNVFWVRANYDDEMAKLVAAAHTIGYRRIGMVHADDPFGHSLLAAFKAACSARGIEPAVIATTPSTTSQEVAPAAKRVAQAQPQVVVAGLAGTLPEMVRALRAAGYEHAIYGMSVGASAANFEALGPLARGLAFSVVVPSPHAVKFEVVRDYRAHMQAAGSSDFSLPGLEGYINARVLLEGVRRAGPNPTRESVQAALGKMSNFDLGGLQFTYTNGRREGAHFVELVVVGAENRLLS